MKHMKSLTGGALALMLVFSGATEMQGQTPQQRQAGQKAAAKKVSFEGLIDQNGSAVHEASFAGKHRLGFAGFTQCPMVCPMIRGKLIQTMKMIEKNEGAAFTSNVVPFMVTIDPKNDTPQALKKYYANTGVLGFTGSEAALTTTLTNLGAAFDFKQLSHDVILRLVNPQGKVILEIPSLLPPETLAQKITQAVKAEQKVQPHQSLER